MCFYDQYKFACGDFKWGNFRQHCNHEYRTGETCGLKFIMQTFAITTKCKTCEKIDTKKRRRNAEVERIARWQLEAWKYKASIEKAYSTVASLDREIYELECERLRRAQTMC